VQKLHVFVEELVADSPSNAKVIVDHLMLGTSGIAIPRRLRQFSVAGTIGSKWCPAIVNMVDMKRQLLDTSLRLDIKLNME
jgi:G3E family GTPase